MSSKDVMVNTESLVKAQTSLNSLMGTSVQFSGQMAEEFSSIQQRLKLSDEAMASFTKLGLQNGGSLKENLAAVSKTTLALNNQNKIGFISPVGFWLRENPAMVKIALNELNQYIPVNKNYLKSLIDAPNQQDFNKIKLVWGLVVLFHWLKL
jgi:hypothetical protein